MRVFAADEKDVADLAQLRALWREASVTPEFLASFSAWFLREQSSRWWWLAADETQRVVGMVNVKLFDRMPSPGAPPSRWGYLANLYVLPQHWRSGVGGALVQAAVHRAQQERLVRLVLFPSEQSMSLYRRFGFRPAHELLMRPLRDH